MCTMRLLRKKKSSGESADWEDAKVAMQESGSWIKNADTKVTILAAVLGVSLTILAGQSSRIVGALQRQDVHVVFPLAFALAGVVVTSIGTLFFVGECLRPRTVKVSEDNRFAWPSMAGRSSAPLSFPSASRVAEAWEQAFALSKIVEAKYRSFRWALRMFLGLIFFIVAVLILSAMPHV